MASPSAAAKSIASAAWKGRLQRSLSANKSLANSRYVQIATVKPDGRPANRTVVFRGFLDEGDDLTFVTDKRSNKLVEVASNPAAEVCWYFPITREQYRISGDLTIVEEGHSDAALLQARQKAWAKMSDSGRVQFGWPNPGEPRVGDPDAFSRPAPGAEEPALSTFCLVVMKVCRVDYLSLKKNVRDAYELDNSSGQWREEALNP